MVTERHHILHTIFLISLVLTIFAFPHQANGGTYNLDCDNIVRLFVSKYTDGAGDTKKTEVKYTEDNDLCGTLGYFNRASGWELCPSEAEGDCKVRVHLWAEFDISALAGKEAGNIGLRLFNSRSSIEINQLHYCESQPGTSACDATELKTQHKREENIYSGFKMMIPRRE